MPATPYYPQPANKCTLAELTRLINNKIAYFRHVSENTSSSPMAAAIMAMALQLEGAKSAIHIATDACEVCHHPLTNQPMHSAPFTCLTPDCECEGIMPDER